MSEAMSGHIHKKDGKVQDFLRNQSHTQHVLEGMNGQSTSQQQQFQWLGGPTERHGISAVCRYVIMSTWIQTHAACQTNFWGKISASWHAVSLQTPGSNQMFSFNLSFSCNCVRKAGVLSLSLSINDGRERKLWMEALLAARDPVNLLSGDISASRRCESSFSSTRNPQVFPWPSGNH